MTKRSMSRFFGVVETLIDGLRSGQLSVEPENFSTEALGIAAETMQAGLRGVTGLLASSELRGAALCSCLWDRVLSDAQQNIETRWPNGGCSLSYWLLRSDIMVGHYAQPTQDEDREHIGSLYSNKLPLEESPCGQTLLTNQPAFFPEVASLFDSTLLSKAVECVGSLATWPVSRSATELNRESPIAVLLLEARTPGTIEDHPETRLFLSNLAELFVLSYQITLRDSYTASLTRPFTVAEPPTPQAIAQSELSNPK